MSQPKLFAMLPPFYLQPPHSNVKWYLRRIQEECAVRIEKCRYLRAAFSCDVFIINDKTVFRFPRTERIRNHLKHEIEFLNFLADKVKTRVPRYSYFSKGGDFAGYTIIPGKILTAAAFKSLSKPKKEQVVGQLVAFINDFHNIKLNDFQKFKPKAREAFIHDEKKIELKLSTKLFPRLPKAEVRAIENFYKQSKVYLGKIPTFCPTHGDLYADNVVWNEGKSEIGVIDFTDVLIGDPAKDFEVFAEYGSEYAAMAYQQYAGPKDADFLKRAEIYHKVHSIYTLLSSVLGARISYDYAYRRFKQRFTPLVERVGAQQ
jgi:aminoglycoside 2''-phosphotransferase